MVYYWVSHIVYRWSIELLSGAYRRSWLVVFAAVDSLDEITATQLPLSSEVVTLLLNDMDVDNPSQTMVFQFSIYICIHQFKFWGRTGVDGLGLMGS